MTDMRIAVIGNSGGGKSALARRLASELRLPYVEVDCLLWMPGWTLTPATVFDQVHARTIAADRWVIEGLGARTSLPARLQRATHIVLIDMPLWVHFWLAAERHIAWSAGRLEHPPAGSTEPAPLKALFRTIAEVNQDWMPEMRKLVQAEEHRGKRVVRIRSYEALASFSSVHLSAS
jgi:adenylate kinase family enzyme